MKQFFFLLIFSLLMLCSCKKNEVDASNTRNFQSSINDMTSNLPTIQQIKFSEALFILKKFGVEGDDDQTELKNLGKLINGMKVPQILALADQTAQKNNVVWSSTGAPSLGEMNIFGNETAASTDPNDVPAKSLDIIVRPIAIDSVIGPKALQITPRLVDGSNKPVHFASGAALETIMEVSSNGTRLLTSKNLMLDNNFKGFTLRFASLQKDKIVNGKIDLKITVKTTKKNFQLIKAGIPINENALLMPVVAKTQDTNTGPNTTENPTTNNPENSSGPTNVVSATTTPVKPVSDPKSTVNRFLTNLGSQNLKGAYDVSDNPNWGSYDRFSNPTSGFGAVKNLNVKNVSINSATSNSAIVNANYDVTDNDGKTNSLKVTFGLKNVNGEWKISSYKIN